MDRHGRHTCERAQAGDPVRVAVCRKRVAPAGKALTRRLDAINAVVDSAVATWAVADRIRQLALLLRYRAFDLDPMRQNLRRALRSPPARHAAAGRHEGSQGARGQAYSPACHR